VYRNLAIFLNFVQIRAIENLLNALDCSTFNIKYNFSDMRTASEKKLPHKFAFSQTVKLQGDCGYCWKVP
jgi:hypothetical protein